MAFDNRKTVEGKNDRRSSRRSLLKGLLAGSLGAVIPASVRSADYDFRGVREEVVAAIESHKATGIAVAVVHQGRIIWEEGFGVANRDTGAKVSEHTPFCLASLTKPFTTTTMMTLVAAGKVSLDHPANRYLGQKSGLKGNAEGATVRLLGAHAAGLPTMFEMFPCTGDRRPSVSTALLENYETLAYPPNEVYEYSNIGFEALCRIASNVTGLEFGEVLARQVLKPLGMNDSFFDTDNKRLPSGAVLYDESDRPIPDYFTVTPPSGALYASAHDVARFGLFNLKNHPRDRAVLLSDHFIDELHSPVFQGPAGASTTFGWFSRQTKSGLPVLFKDGAQPGVSSIMYIVPQENLACVALANRSNNGDVLVKLVDQMAGVIIRNWTTPDNAVGYPMSDFPGGSVYKGKWSGRLHGGGAEMAVSIEFTLDGSATLSLGSDGPEKVKDLHLQGSAVVGQSVGAIESVDAIRSHATALSLKLLLRNDKLAGRVLASASAPGEIQILPYIVELERSK